MKFVLLLLVQISYIVGQNYFYQPPVLQFPQPVFHSYLPRVQPEIKTADVQVLSAQDGLTVVGRVKITDTGAGTLLEGEIWGLTPGYHGFHIHEKGDLGDMCKEAGGHFNPDEKEHGAPTDENRHAGDLGNIDAGPDGIARIYIFDHHVRLDGSKYDVTGKAIVVHADPDDLGRGGFDDSKKTGHAGARVACGVIRPLH